MTPLIISICLHYHCRVEDYPGNFPIFDETMSSLIEAGLIERAKGEMRSKHNMRFQATKKLHAYVDTLCETPLPRLAWINTVTNTPILNV